MDIWMKVLIAVMEAAATHLAEEAKKR